MSEYSPPDNLNPIFNPNEYLVAEKSLALATADGRYLKLTGGVVGGLTTFNAGLNSAGVCNISNSTQSTTTTNGALAVSVLILQMGAILIHFGGTVHAPVGTASAPTFSFISDPDTGVFLNGSNVVSIEANGILSASISDTELTSINPITVPLGSLSNCAIQFNGDPNTGIYSGFADSLGLVCGGDARFTLGTISCDITPPLRCSNGTVALPSISFSGDSDTGIYSNGTNSMGFSTNEVLRQTIDTSRITTLCRYVFQMIISTSAILNIMKFRRK